MTRKTQSGCYQRALLGSRKTGTDQGMQQGLGYCLVAITARLQGSVLHGGLAPRAQHAVFANGATALHPLTMCPMLCDVPKLNTALVVATTELTGTLHRAAWAKCLACFLLC